MTDVFALDPLGAQALEQDAARTLATTADIPPAMFAGMAEESKQVFAGSASLGRTLLTAGKLPAKQIEGVLNLTGIATGTRAPGRFDTEVSEAYERDVVQGLGQNAVDAWTPDSAGSGTAATILGTALNVAGRLPQMIGAPAAFLIDSGVAPALDTLQEGGGPDAALTVAGINLGVNAIGMGLPAAFGKTLATRVATGAGANLGMGIGANAGSQATLEDAGLTEYAASWDPLNPQALLLDGLMGAAFGVKAHVDAPPTMKPSERAAVLTANNAHHFNQATLPGEPLNPAAALQHTDALESAIRSVLAGEPVNVDVDLSGFQLRPELAPSSAGFDSAVARVLDDEGGFVNDPVDRGGATNFGISSRANPDIDVANLTRERAADIYKARYWDPIQADTLPADLQGIAFDAAVNQGVGWTKGALRESGGDVSRFADLREQRYRQIVKDDPSQAKFLNGWMKRLRTYRQDLPNFGLAEAPRPIADTDPIWQQIPEGANGKRETQHINTPEREALRDQLVEEHFAGLEARILGDGERPVAYLMGGGGASGKGTLLEILQGEGEVPRGIVEVDPDRIKTGDRNHGISGIPEYDAMLKRGDSRAAAVVHEESSTVAGRVKERAIAERRDMVVDRTLGNPGKALTEIQALKDAGYEVRLYGVTLDPAEAVERAVKRAKGKGRYVPLLDLLTAHKGFATGFEDYAALVDQARLYDNTVEFEQIASASQGQLSIDAEAGYNQFVKRRQTNESAETYRSLAAPAEAGAAGVPAGSVRAGDPEAGPGRTGAGRPDGLDPAGTAQALDPARFPVQGADTTVVTERGLRLPVRYAVVELDSLVTSHDNALQVNPAFPAELQPRDRARAASEQQIARIANNLDPELLGASPKAADGAPIVGTDQVVESGNARTIALRRAYATGKGEDYRTWLADNAAQFGLDPAALDAGPVTGQFERSLNDAPAPGSTIYVTRMARPGRESLANANGANIDGATYLLGKQDDMESSVGVPDDAVLTVWAVTAPAEFGGYTPAMAGEGRGGVAIDPGHVGRGKAMRADADSVWYSFGEASGGAAKQVASVPLVDVRAAKAAELGDPLFAYSVQDTEWLRGFVQKQIDQAAPAGGMKQPVLVRVSTGEYDRAEFARQANESTVAGMSATEVAMADARQLPDLGGLRTNDDGSINMGGSAKFVAGLIERIGPNERAAMTTADGQLSQAGASRIRNAVFARAYGDADLVAMLTEATDANVKNVLAGMLRAAPEIARIRGMIAEGGRYGPDLGPDLVAAVRKFSQLRSEGLTVEQFEAQGDFFGDGGLTPKARDLLRTVGENARAPKRFAEFLQRYVDAVEVLGDPRQADLMGGSKADPVQTAAKATSAANDAPAPKAGGLFNAAGRATIGAEANGRTAPPVPTTVTPLETSREEIGQGQPFVTDSSGKPLLVYRGTHGDRDPLDTRHGSISFGSREAADTYANDPNDLADTAVKPQVTAAYVRISKPVIVNRDDPFIEAPQLIDAVGEDAAREIVLRHARHVENTGNWIETIPETYGRQFADVAEFLGLHPEGLRELYLDAYVVFDDPAAVALFKAAGYDGAIHVGNGVTGSEDEFKVFDRSQVVTVKDGAPPPSAAPKPAPAVTPENRAAYEAIAAMPDLQVIDDAGVLRPAAEFLAEGDAAILEAEQTTRAIDAAANCLLRTAA